MSDPEGFDAKFLSHHVVLMDYIIAIIPLFFGMGLVAAGFLATYFLYRYIVRIKSDSEDVRPLFEAAQFVAVATIWMLVFTVLFKGMDIVESLVPQVAVHGRIQGPSEPRKEKAHPPNRAGQSSKTK